MIQSAAQRPALSRFRRTRFHLETLEPRQVLAADVIISEFSASNGGAIEDVDGFSPDWIELFNAGDAEADLTGWRLTDLPNDPTPWTFPAGTRLAPGGFLVVFADGKNVVDSASKIHTDFSLSAGGEYVALINSSGAVISEFGNGGTSYPEQFRDVSYGISQRFVETPLVGLGSEARVLVPTVGNGGSTLNGTWRGATANEPFNDSSWLREVNPGVPVTTGIGFGNIGPQVAIAGELLVELDAADATAGSASWVNRGTLADFAERGDAIRSTVNGVPAVTFDGLTDWYEGPNASSGLVGLNATRSVEVWAYNPLAGNEETMVAWGARGGANGTNAAFNFGSNASSGAVSHTGPGDLGWASVPQPGEWHHLVYTFDGTTTRIYDNSALVGSEDVGAGQINTLADLPIRIAAQRNADGTATNLGALSIGKIRIHDGVLSEAQVQQNFELERVTFLPVAPGTEIEPPIHRYSFNGTATTAVDSIGGLNGTLVNGATVSSNALQLDGTNDHVELPAAQLAINTFQQITVEMWGTYSTTTGLRSRVFDFGNKSGTSGANYFYFAPNSGFGGGASASISNSNLLGEQRADYNQPLHTGERVHVAVVFDDATDRMKLYVDGNLVSDSTVVRSLATVGTSFAYLGRSLYNSFPYLKGSIDEFRIYDYALSAPQIAGNFEAGPDLLNLVVGEAQPAAAAEEAGSARGLVATDIGSAMQGVNSSAFVRVPFEVANPAVYETLTLKMRYDDGFVAYLNGTEIARRNAPGVAGGILAFNAAATAARADADETRVDDINVTSFLGLLRPGANVLAIQGLNASAADDDFLVLPELIATDINTSVPGYFAPPTPGAVNGVALAGFVADTTFSVDRGFYTQPFDVTIATSTIGATIVYTTDGSEPTLSNGTVIGPANDNAPNSVIVPVTSTTTLRAAAFKPGFRPTNIDTQSYIFLTDVAQQTRANVLARGFPATWGGNVVDYDVDPRIASNPASPYYDPTFQQDLLTIPTVSVVIPNDSFFGAARGIYANAARRGDDWERATSVELIDPNDPGRNFQVDAGIRASGGVGRSTSTPRHSMRLVFSDDYGPSTLTRRLFGDTEANEFNGLYLRGGWNYTWTGDSGGNTQRADYLRDQFGRDTVKDMGGLTPHGEHVHLYINGLYWGIYNLHERPDATFAEEYLGPSADGFDVLKTPAEQFSNVTMEINSGDRIAWDQLFALANSDLSQPANYQAISQLVDIPALVDYLMMVFYTGSRDSPVLLGNNVEPRNFWAVRKREAGNGFHFIPWDVEWSLEDPNVNRVNITGRENPHVLFQALKANDEFRRFVQDKIQEYFFNGGLLTREAATARYLERAQAIDRAIIGESARWGDTLRPNQPYTRENEWLTEQGRLVNQFFAVRTDVVLQQLRDAGWFPDIAGPTYQLNGTPQHGGEADAGDIVTVSVPAGTITNDIDIVAPGAAVRVFVPSDDSLGTTWTQRSFNDTAWLAGTTGVGFENATGYQDLIDPAINTHLLANMFGSRSSVFSRVTFNYNSSEPIESLVLRMKYDDGFVAYLNGTEVARSSTLAAGTINVATLAANRPDDQAIIFEDFNITNRANLLVQGANVLSIHGVNQAIDSSDLLFVPALVRRVTTEIESSAPVYVTTDGSDPRRSDGSISPSATVFGAQATTLIGPTAPLHVLVPSVANGGSGLGTTWTGGTEPFNVSTWTSGVGPVGYDTGQGPATIATAGTLYVSLDARDPSAGTATWVNGGTLGNFTRQGTPVLINRGPTNQPAVDFRVAADHFLGPNSIPDLEGSSARSIEVWAFNPTVGEQNGEETLVSWGRRGGPDGSNMGFNYGNSPNWGAVTHWGGAGPDMPWEGGVPETGKWHHLAYTYDGVNTARVYVDGELNYQENVGLLLTHAGFPIVLSAQNTTGGLDFAQSFIGSIGAVRVHGEMLTANQVLNNFQVDAARFGAPQNNYDDIVRTDIQTAMSGQNGSAFVRIPFNVAASADFDRLELRVKYDDGYVAYLNGVEVARRNAPANVNWNSIATSDRPDSQAVVSELVDLSSHVSLLRPGQANILAVHGLNVSAGDSDFLLGAELSAISVINSQIVLQQSTELNARSLTNGSWGPLSAATFIVTPPAEEPGVVISEINYNPYEPTVAELAAIPGVDNDDFEFIEVMNANSTDPMSLIGMRLGNGVDFAFPNATLAPNEFAVIVRNETAFRQRYGNTVRVLGTWTGNLSNAGETIVLTDALSQELLRVAYADGQLWPARADGPGATLEAVTPATTAASQFNKHYQWRGSSEWGGSPGRIGQAPIGVEINEVRSRTELPSTALDAIELYNPTSQPINIGGWYLSDAESDLRKFAIPAGTVLGPGQYVVFDESDFNPTPANPLPQHFALNGTAGDDVWLTIASSATTTTFVDDVHFGAMKSGTTLGRAADGSARLLPVTRVTLGCENSAHSVGPVVISEVQYAPAQPSPAALAIAPLLTSDDLEYVELYNPQATNVTMTNWRIRGGIDYDFVAGTTIPSRTAVLLVSFNPTSVENASRTAAFRAHYGLAANVTLLGGFAGRLDNNGENIQLQRPDTPSATEPTVIPRVIEDEVVYDTVTPWPTSVISSGASLQRKASIYFGSDAESWRGAAATPGTVTFALGTTGDVSGDGLVNASDIDYLYDLIRQGNQSLQADLDNNATVDSADVTRLVQSIMGRLFGDANLDGAVDGSDFNQWNRHKFDDCGAGWSKGDFNGDGTADASDFNIWFNNRFRLSADLAAVARTPRAPLANRVVPMISPVATIVDAAFASEDDSVRSSDRDSRLSHRGDATVIKRESVNRSLVHRNFGRQVMIERRTNDRRKFEMKEMSSHVRIADQLFGGSSDLLTS